jgi:hypothetical protein
MFRFRRMRRRLYQLGRLLSLQTKTTCTASLRTRQGHLKFVSHLLDDIITSVLITVSVYLLALFVIYAQISSNRLADPSQVLNLESKCSSIKLSASSNDTDVLTDLSVLSTFVSSTLDNLGHKYFICYQSLFELLRLNDWNNSHQRRHSIDICVYDSSSNLASVLQNVADLFGYSKLERSLYNSKLIKYEFDRLFGSVKIQYHTASAILYLFSQAPPNRMNFEGIRRSGILYTQFEFLIEHLKVLNRLPGLVYFDNESEGGRRTGVSVNVLNRLPMYMLESEGVDYKVRLGQSYFALPVEPYDSLMYFYPESWWKHVANCTL